MTRFLAEPRDADTEAPPVVVVVGRAAHDTARIDNWLRSGAVVVMADERRSLDAWVMGRGPNGNWDLPPVLLVGPLEVDLDQHQARWHSQPLPLTERELQILAVLMRRPGSAWTFCELARHVWGYETTDGSEVRSAVKRLRRKLTTAGMVDPIESVRSVGFRLSTRSTFVI